MDDDVMDDVVDDVVVTNFINNTMDNLDTLGNEDFYRINIQTHPERFNYILRNITRFIENNLIDNNNLLKIIKIQYYILGFMDAKTYNVDDENKVSFN